MTSRFEPYGVPLKEEDMEREKVLTVAYRPKANYSWAAGKAIGEFLRGLKAGVIIGTKCDKCGRTVVPPRIFCEWCFRRTENWVRLPDKGTVNTYSVSYITTDTTRVKTPTIPAVIIIDGTSNAGFLHTLGEVKADDVRIGLRVKAVWKEESERHGSITDIRYFAPAKE